MTNYSNNVLSDEVVLIFDSSVIINLKASSYGEQIVQSLPGRKVVTETVVGELNDARSQKHGTNILLNEILKKQLIEAVEMNNSEIEFYRYLISEDYFPKIDSGEASVISVAKCAFSGTGFIPVIDEKNGRKVAKEVLDGVDPMISLDLFLDPTVISILGKQEVSDAIFSALKFGRMHIPESRVELVIEFIGLKRARECNSLPGFKLLFS